MVDFLYSFDPIHSPSSNIPNPLIDWFLISNARWKPVATAMLEKAHLVGIYLLKVNN